jgi:hypothetical protein
VLGEGNEPLRFIDSDSGRDVRLELVDPESGERVDPARARLVPGPAFRLREEGDVRLAGDMRPNLDGRLAEGVSA